ISNKLNKKEKDGKNLKEKLKEEAEILERELKNYFKEEEKIKKELEKIKSKVELIKNRIDTITNFDLNSLNLNQYEVEELEKLKKYLSVHKDINIKEYELLVENLEKEINKIIQDLINLDFQNLSQDLTIFNSLSHKFVDLTNTYGIFFIEETLPLIIDEVTLEVINNIDSSLKYFVNNIINNIPNNINSDELKNSKFLINTINKNDQHVQINILSDKIEKQVEFKYKNTIIPFTSCYFYTNSFISLFNNYTLNISSLLLSYYMGRAFYCPLTIQDGQNNKFYFIEDKDKLINEIKLFIKLKDNEINNLVEQLFSVLKSDLENEIINKAKSIEGNLNERFIKDAISQKIDFMKGVIKQNFLLYLDYFVSNPYNNLKNKFYNLLDNIDNDILSEDNNKALSRVFKEIIGERKIKISNYTPYFNSYFVVEFLSEKINELEKERKVKENIGLIQNYIVEELHLNKEIKSLNLNIRIDNHGVFINKIAFVFENGETKTIEFNSVLSNGADKTILENLLSICNSFLSKKDETVNNLFKPVNQNPKEYLKEVIFALILLWILKNIKDKLENDLKELNIKLKDFNFDINSYLVFTLTILFNTGENLKSILNSQDIISKVNKVNSNMLNKIVIKSLLLEGIKIDINENNQKIIIKEEEFRLKLEATENSFLHSSVNIKLKNELSLEFNKNIYELITVIIKNLEISSDYNYITWLFLNNISNFTIIQGSNFSCGYVDRGNNSFKCNLSTLDNPIQELIGYIKNKNGGVLPTYIYLNISAELRDNNNSYPSLEEIKNNSSNIKLVINNITAVQKK
ncbi:MAG: hypothetical protein ABGW69_00320, partial [Nanoarchaeota archaeon]